MRYRAFTLAEVLITLALLGVIAAFIIPKVLTSQGEVEQKARFKEIYGTLSDMYYKASLDGELYRFSYNNPNREPIFPYLQQHLNVLRACPNGARQGGCRTTVASGSEAAGFLLMNGAVVTTVSEDRTFYENDMLIDLNGDAEPNTVGEDMVYVIGVSTTYAWCGIKPYSIGAPDPVICPEWGGGTYGAVNQKRFRELLQ